MRYQYRRRTVRSSAELFQAAEAGAQLRDRTPTFSVGLLRPNGLQKSRQLRRRFVLGNRLQFLERAGECVRQTPHGPRLEFLMHGLEVQIMHSPREVLGKPRLLLDERLVDQKLGRDRKST